MYNNHNNGALVAFQLGRDPMMIVIGIKMKQNENNSNVVILMMVIIYVIIMTMMLIVREGGGWYPGAKFLENLFHSCTLLHPSL